MTTILAGEDAISRVRGLAPRVWGVHHYSESAGALVLRCTVGDTYEESAYLVVCGFRAGHLATIFRLVDVRLSAGSEGERGPTSVDLGHLLITSDDATYDLACEGVRLLEGARGGELAAHD